MNDIYTHLDLKLFRGAIDKLPGASMEHPMLDSAEWDFSYLEKHEHLKRSAVLYEYGRENHELVKWILYLRKFGPFGSSKTHLPAEKGVEDKIQQRIYREIDVLMT